jgi:hypothetical protein
LLPIAVSARREWEKPQKPRKPTYWSIFKLIISEQYYRGLTQHHSFSHVDVVITALMLRIQKASDSFFGRKPATPTVLLWFFGVTPRKFWSSTLKLNTTRGSKNSGQLHFVRWRLTGLISEQVSQSFPHAQKMCFGSHVLST